MSNVTLIRGEDGPLDLSKISDKTRNTWDPNSGNIYIQGFLESEVPFGPIERKCSGSYSTAFWGDQSLCEYYDTRGVNSISELAKQCGSSRWKATWLKLNSDDVYDYICPWSGGRRPTHYELLHFFLRKTETVDPCEGRGIAVDAPIIVKAAHRFEEEWREKPRSEKQPFKPAEVFDEAWHAAVQEYFEWWLGKDFRKYAELTIDMQNTLKYRLGEDYVKFLKEYDTITLSKEQRDSWEQIDL